MAPNYITQQDDPCVLRPFDAHCHPTDIMASIDNIPNLRAAGLTVMSTRMEDQSLVEETARRYGGDLAVAGQGEGRVVPAFGWHPWFSHLIIDDTEKPAYQGETETETDEDIRKKKKRKIEHYTVVLQPTPNYDGNEEDKAFVDALPHPFPLSQLISDTRERLGRFPAALIGEIGLDKSFRLPKPWPDESKKDGPGDINGELTPGTREGRPLSRFRVRMTHQKRIFEAQLRLGGEMNRAASVHSVGAHGAVLDVLTTLWKGWERPVVSKRKQRKEASDARAAGEEEGEEDEEASADTPYGPRPFPPRVCMHSYSGPPEQLAQFYHPSVPIDFYFSFSTYVNFEEKDETQANKIAEVIRTVPDDRILAESDLHCAGDLLDDALAKAVGEICRILQWKRLDDGTRKLNDNWRTFVYGRRCQ
ncbi:hypothetical protein KEM56_000655 [Ascosphaera pollenicola]|nr:hypothetical protein KEM56_000655 [Ascosphaera pollenicola]